MVLYDGEHISIVSIYIDDLLIAGSTMNQVLAAKRTLQAAFQMKDLGEARVIVGMRIIRDR
jgi:ATP-binding cassette subfamily B (MDR/TAP) protein 1